MNKIYIAIIIAVAFMIFIFKNDKIHNLPIVAIANYGPHSSIDASIKGIKDELTRDGFINGKTIDLEIADISFDNSLISQMVAKFKNKKPKVIVVISTPIAQYAKGSITDIPIVYNVITDPVEAGLIKDSNSPDGNITGSSDRQDLNLMLEFAKELLPKAKRVGLLYSPSEANDVALVKMMQKAADNSGMKLLSIPVMQARDIPIAMQNFKGNIDFLYVGTSGQIQPTLPAIASECNKMEIPIINVDEGAVVDGMVLASFGVDYIKVGENTGKLVAQILRGVDVSKLRPLYPAQKDHRGFINRKIANQIGLAIPLNTTNLTIVE